MTSSSSPLVTVYIPCRNYGRFLGQALDSLRAQLHGNWEAIVVDEASDDDTPAIAARYAALDKRIRTVRNATPIGVQKVANRVLGLAGGKYIVRLDADDWLDEGALLLMVAKLEANPDIGIVYGNYFYTNEAGNVIGTERRHRLGEEDMVGHLAPHGACTMVRARSLKAVGGYSEDINAQDGWELWYKLQNRVGAASLDVPVFYYRQHDTSLSRDNTRLLKARARIFEKIADRMGGAYVPTVLAVVAVRENYPDFEGVPYRIFEGRSLLERALSSASESRHVTHVALSSESQTVLDHASKLEETGAIASHRRLLRPAQARGALPIRDILHHAGLDHQDQHGAPPDILAFLSLHAVNRRADHLNDAVNTLRVTESDSVISVLPESEPLFAHGANGLALLNPGRFRDLAYDRERFYAFNGCVLASWWEIIESGELLGTKIGFVEMSEKDSFQIKAGPERALASRIWPA